MQDAVVFRNIKEGFGGKSSGFTFLQTDVMIGLSSSFWQKKINPLKCVTSFDKTYGCDAFLKKLL